MAINIYGNKDPYLDYALSNKLYSAALMGMPILVSQDTYMAEVVNEYKIGFIVDLEDENFADDLFEFYKNIKREELFNNCDKFMKRVLDDEKNYAIKLCDWINDKKGDKQS